MFGFDYRSASSRGASAWAGSAGTGSTSEELYAEAAATQKAAKLAAAREYEAFGREIAKRFAPDSKGATDAIALVRRALDAVREYAQVVCPLPGDLMGHVSTSLMKIVPGDSDDETDALPSDEGCVRVRQGRGAEREPRCAGWSGT